MGTAEIVGCSACDLMGIWSYKKVTHPRRTVRRAAVRAVTPKPARKVRRAMIQAQNPGSALEGAAKAKLSRAVSGGGSTTPRAQPRATTTQSSTESFLAALITVLLALAELVLLILDLAMSILIALGAIMVAILGAGAGGSRRR